MNWLPIDTAPEMKVVLIAHPYYSHGQVRQGFRRMDGNWWAVNADGTDSALYFQPEKWMPLPKAF